MINETVINTIPQVANTMNLFALWGILISLFPIITYIYKSKKTNWGNFWVVWFFTALISGILLAFLTISPNWVTDTLTKIMGAI